MDAGARAVLRRLLGADGGEGGDAVHDGHHHVHQDKVEDLPAQGLDRLGAILDQHQVLPQGREQERQQLAVGGMVFGGKHPQRTHDLAAKGGRARADVGNLRRHSPIGRESHPEDRAMRGRVADPDLAAQRLRRCATQGEAEACSAGLPPGLQLFERLENPVAALPGCRGPDRGPRR